jgi:hypothetical protein
VGAGGGGGDVDEGGPDAMVFFYLEQLFPLTNGTSGNLKFCEGKIEKTSQVFF